MVRLLRDDDGFTLTELIVVTGLLGMILAIAYAGFNVTAKGSDMSNRQSMISREIGAPLLHADRVLTQAYDFDSRFPGLGPYRCAFYTDQDGDGDAERHVIEAVGNELRISTEEENGRPYKMTAWSTHNANRATGIPLFRYYRSDGVEITTMGEVSTDVKSVVMTIVVDYDGTKIQDTRTMFLRNR